MDSNYSLVEVQSLEINKDPVTCRPDTPIREAATVMTRKQVGSIVVVDEHFLPIGIVTDEVLRTRVATGQVPLDESVTAIMSSPVITLTPNITVADLQIEMVKRRVRHLCITEDGTAASKVIGVFSEHDLMVVQGNNPSAVVREVRRCHDAESLRQIRERSEELLKKYIYQEVSISFISNVISEINDEITKRAITLSEREMEQEGHQNPRAGYCWLALGSAGRREQLLRTDQDNALLFASVPGETAEATRAYYLKLAGKITHQLDHIGFEYCPADIIASNPSWCLSLGEWKRQFSEWIFEPSPKAVMLCTIFFDYRPIAGDASLVTGLTSHILDSIEKQYCFLAFLAKDALRNPPPLTLLRNFSLETSGEHKNEFDIKSRGMMPLADAARVLTLNAKVGNINNTVSRFEKLAELEPHNKELFERAVDAYETLMRFRAMQGLLNHDSGRYLRPSELAKSERINLHNCFRPIKELQSLLVTRFQLSLLG